MDCPDRDHADCRLGRDVADAGCPDLAGVGCRLLVGFAGRVQVGEEVRRLGEQPRVEAGLARLDDGVAGVQALVSGPGIQVGVPGLVRCEPQFAVAVQPALLAGVGQPVEAPSGGCLVELLVRPLHDDEHAAGCQGGCGMVEDVVEVVDVVQ